MRTLLCQLPGNPNPTPLLAGLAERDPFLQAVAHLLETYPLTWQSVVCQGRDGAMYRYTLAPAMVQPTDTQPDGQRIIVGPEMQS